MFIVSCYQKSSLVLDELENSGVVFTGVNLYIFQSCFCLSCLQLESHDTRGHISSDRASNESEFRTMEEMVKEAAMLATYFPDGGV